MKPWEIWTGRLFGEHPVLTVSATHRVELKKHVVVIKVVSQRPGQKFKVNALQAVLDEDDGLDWDTRFDCDLLYTSTRTTCRKSAVKSARWNAAGTFPGS